ncbi:glycosyltransferase family 39 protein [Arthrobacter sp. 92]|uniref:glycosyltransferase family 39 protein n=1 Tax=Arthrobacter sp. 92 TaxID=3418175 RepID=UPI003D053AF9
MIKLSWASVSAGLLAFIYSGIGSWRPSFWTDEAATISAVRRSFPDLMAMLGSIDAVHGAYYILIFGWTRLFGYSELAVRFPSLIAVAISALLMVEIGRKLSSVRYGVLAAAALVLLPRAQYAATDARSYALTLLGAVAATYVLVSIRENPRLVKWAAYALVGVVTVSLSFYSVFLFVAHAVTLLWDQKLRENWRGMLAASVGWIAPALYVGCIASQQQFQISWIRPVGPSFPFEFALLQFFGDGYFAKEGRVAPVPTPGEDFSMVALAILMWTAAAAGLILCRRHFLVRLALPWLVIPALAVISASLVTGGNYYLPRYLTFELPALAILAAAPATLHGAGALRRIRIASAVGAAIALCVSVPSYVGQRTQYGRDPQDDFRYIATSVEKLSGPGDAFVIGPAQDLAYQAYPDSFKGLADPTLGITAAEWKRIFDQRFDVASSATKILQHPTVILVEKTGESTMAGALRKLGYAPGESLQGPATTVTKYSLK